MPQSEEQVAHLPSAIDIAYDTFGDRSDPALLLIMGLTGPLNWWSVELCEMLADKGFFVIRFDNRDVGRSSKLKGTGGTRGGVVKSFIRTKSTPPYTLNDMAEDAVGLLDELGIKRAHVTGVSMGGMIAQIVTIEHPDRVLSLVSIMSTTGRRTVGWADPRLLPNLIGPRPRNREEFVERSAATWRRIGSPGYPTPPEEIRSRALETLDRGMSASGALRQMQAILTQPDRTLALRQVKAPSMVIHGLSDRLVHPSGGRATAHALPGCELLLVPGMGHDMPSALWPTFVEGIVRTAARASKKRAAKGSSRA